MTISDKDLSYSPVTRTLGPVLGSQQPSCPWVPCVPPGLWGPQGAQNYLWGTLWAMQGQWVHGDLLAHTTKGWLCQCTPHHAQTRPQNGHKPAAQPGMMYSLLLLTGMAAPLALGHIFAAHAAQMVAFPAVLTNQHAALLSAAPLVRCLTHPTCHIEFL